MFWEHAGHQILQLSEKAGQGLLLLKSALAYLPQARRNWRRIAQQMLFCGVESIPVVSITAIFTGMVMALQTGLELKPFGIEERIGDIIGAAICREMGPVWTAVILAGRVGSAMAAEIGTMKISEEIDALEVMTIDPARYLVMPRIAALVLMAPILTIFADVVGVFGGSVVGYYQINIPYHVYYDRVFSFLQNKDVYTGLFKSLTFALTIGTIACHQGLNTTNGAEGVGKATTRTVVYSFLMVLILDYFITSIFY